MNQITSLCLIIVVLLAGGWYITLLKSEKNISYQPGATYENASHSLNRY